VLLGKPADLPTVHPRSQFRHVKRSSCDVEVSPIAVPVEMPMALTMMIGMEMMRMAMLERLCSATRRPAPDPLRAAP